jgi:hypothetical protein
MTETGNDKAPREASSSVIAQHADAILDRARKDLPKANSAS